MKKEPIQQDTNAPAEPLPWDLSGIAEYRESIYRDLDRMRDQVFHLESEITGQGIGVDCSVYIGEYPYDSDFSLSLGLSKIGNKWRVVVLTIQDNDIYSIVSTPFSSCKVEIRVLAFPKIGLLVEEIRRENRERAENHRRLIDGIEKSRIL